MAQKQTKTIEFSIVTINIGNRNDCKSCKSSPDQRTKFAIDKIKNCKTSNIIFLQEIASSKQLDKFEDLENYTTLSTTEESFSKRVFWHHEKFTGKLIDEGETNIPKDLKGRFHAVKITSVKIPKLKILAVSYHGRHRNFDDDEKKNLLIQLLETMTSFGKINKADFILIGGDFNLSAEHASKVSGDFNIAVTTRRLKDRDDQEKPVIDYFMWKNLKPSLEVSVRNVRDLTRNKRKSEDTCEVLDHRPVIADMTVER